MIMRTTDSQMRTGAVLLAQDNHTELPMRREKCTGKDLIMGCSVKSGPAVDESVEQQNEKGCQPP
jgi:hypothetical protein